MARGKWLKEPVADTIKPLQMACAARFQIRETGGPTVEPLKNLSP